MLNDKLVIRMEQSGSSGYSNGYAETLRGNTIEYHSSHPEAHTALLARSNAGENSFTWKTGDLHPSADGSVTLVWLGGIAICQDGPHKFELLVDGVPRLTILSGKTKHKLTKHYKDKSGVQLRFDEQLTDMYGDSFGWWYLTLPAGMVNPGKCAELEIRGEDAGSQDWIMVFEYALDNLPKLRIDPVLAKCADGTGQILHINIDSFAGQGSVQIEAPGNRTARYELREGLNSFTAEIEDVRQPSELEVEFYLQGNPVHSQTLTVEPVTPRRVYILPYSHNDIGYTDVQTDVIKKQCANIDAALELAEQTADFPAEARAKWNLEVIWAMEHWWNQAEIGDRARFVVAWRAGQIGLNALYANPLSGLSSLPELNHHFDLAHKLADIIDKRIETATVTDIPGFVWSLQTALADNGVKYFSIAPNAGDRTGHIYAGLGDKPFYWVSPCGTKEVLTWVKGASYSLFHREKITTTGISKLMKYLRTLETKQYPYEIAALPYTIGGDNGGPDENLSQFVKDWNDRYVSPRLIISTHEQLFTDFEKQYGDSLPRLQGDMTPYWEDGAVSTAEETTKVRNAADRLIQTETINSVFYPGGYKKEEYYKAWQQVVLWDEHTWGAWNSVTEPDAKFVRRQWEIKQAYATESRKISKEMLRKVCLFFNPIYKYEKITLFNTRSFPSREVVKLPTFVTTSDDNFSKQFNSLGNQYILMDFPAGFYNVSIPFKAGSGEILNWNDTEVRTIENDNIRMTVDFTNATITSLYHKKKKQQYLKAGTGLLELVYLSGKYPQKASFVKDTTHCHYEKGNLFNRWSIQGCLEGCRWVAIYINLYHHTDRIDIDVSIDKLPIREKESIHLAFPFELEGGVLRYDSAGCPIQPEIDQLPGSCKNFYSPTSYVDVSNADCGVTVALTDAPLIEIGGITAEMPWLETALPGTTFYSYILNNYWHTNYKADQEGSLIFRYSMLLHGEFDPYEAHCFAQICRQPVQFSTPVKEDNYLAMSLIPPEKPVVVLTVTTNMEQHCWLLHVLNVSENSSVWKFAYRKKVQKVFLSTAYNEASGESLSEICLKPYQQIYLSVKF